jgi:hypothetical protein
MTFGEIGSGSNVWNPADRLYLACAARRLVFSFSILQKTQACAHYGCCEGLVASANIASTFADGWVEREATECASSIGRRASSCRELKKVRRVPKIPLAPRTLGFCGLAVSPLGMFRTNLYLSSSFTIPFAPQLVSLPYGAYVLSDVIMVWHEETVNWRIISDQLQVVPKCIRFFLPDDAYVNALAARRTEEAADWINKL